MTELARSSTSAGPRAGARRARSAANTTFAPGAFVGRTVVITGGSRGIGQATTALLAELGARVAVLARDQGRLTATERLARDQGGICLGVACDVREETQLAEARARIEGEFGAVDTVINNHAGNFRIEAKRMTQRALRTVIDIDLIGTFNTTMAFLPALLESGGNIVNIVMPECERGMPHYAHAAAAKAGVVAMSRTWAREFGPSGIRVNCVAPGPVPTDGAQEFMARAGEDQWDRQRERTTLGRLGEPEDVAGAIVFLCSDAARWISGALLNADGGISVA